MIILGLNAYHADSSAAILVGGKLIAATEEERFRRTKHWAGFPSQAIEFCLKEAGITLDQIDYITIGRDPKAKLGKKMKFLLSDPFAGLKTIRERLSNRKKIASLEHEFANHFGADAAAIKSKIKNIEHHRSHMASAFFPSPFEEAAILSIDGAGDFTTTMIGIGRGNQIKVLDSIDFPVSCGTFYTAFTQWLGFPHYGDEYKVMGLAPYGVARYVDKIKKALIFKDNGLFDWDTRYFKSAREVVVTYGENHVPVVGNLFSDHFEKVFGKPRGKNEELTQDHNDIAASVQRVTEELLIHILSHLQKRTGLKAVCIAGGVAQNSVANGKFIGSTGFEKLYIPSAGHDAGLSMGSALYQYHQMLNRPRTEPVFSAYTGSKFSNEEIEALLTQKGIQYKRLPDSELYDRVVAKLIEPGVVGWFSGRAEFGPRALGARSIIADPRNAKAKDLLNSKIKRRESFRPFAPSILKEYVGEYFEKVEDVPFMEKVFPIKKEKQQFIPAVTHVDGTGRLQTVSKDVSPRYYALIDKFRERTGVPILLNTSFNENEPIVNTPAEALDCFLRTQMDMLVLENCLLERM
ncbi:MAG: carbamoyltransferase [Cytophagales bacterium]|nr:carbamoyltransferase [Cytophagales bacterium]MCA6368019.1 carbamoyltransferase [Cytophagales bacterium]MCA6370503.1 carbamoyltransferase [Cytophagales bacterium]MCA6376592.1 carbamoyltransferase [Cytophagales bacterium]MCA6384422.1 carbamoyltransferase [Cytophagales bacterium]